MAKLDTTRLILEDSKGQYWRLCRFAHKKDKYDEPFIKIMFPGFSKGSHIVRNIGFREKDGLLKFFEGKQKRVATKASEITYHYVSGIVNLTEGQRHPIQYRFFPSLFRARRPVLFCRCLLKDFSVCKKISKPGGDDIILKKFPLPCVFGFYAFYGEKPFLIERTDGVSQHLRSSDDSKLTLTVTQYHINSLDGNYIATNKDPYAWKRGTTFLGKIFHAAKNKFI